VAYTYIILSKKLQTYYIGSTSDINKRLIRHNAGFEKYTKRGVPWILVYHEKFDSKSEATKREYEIKRKKSKRYIEQLIKDYKSIPI
jgi:putative endonuclease